jgi:hypothetical protein
MPTPREPAHRNKSRAIVRAPPPPTRWTAVRYPRDKRESMEHKLRLQVCSPRHIDTEVFMSKKLLASALLATSLLAAPAIAFAQTSAPPDNTGPSGEATTAPKAMPMHHHAMRHHMARRSHFEPGTTTGMSSSSRPARATSRKPPAS